jgi:uncharacterized protein (DUF1697 family)
MLNSVAIGMILATVGICYRYPMNDYVALLRAVNVGGTGKLPMSELKAMCEKLNFENVKTYIASGNVVFSSHLEEKAIKGQLEDGLEDYAGKPVGVIVRTAKQIAAVLDKNPFAQHKPSFTVAIFLDEPPHQDALEGISGVQDELCVLGKREIYIHYGSGMGRSKLKIPSAKNGTARNMNTIAKLVQMTSELSSN